ncbi:group 1 glycosyl transferase [Nostoc sp. NIES-4103]|nr:group 1 glycosyl transferase [Nostoc sp. NIES-4103]
MEKITNDTLRLWQEQGRLLIPQNFEVFRTLVAQAKQYTQRGKYDAAAVYAEIAAIHALFKHSGLFASAELEHILLTIGQKAIRSTLKPQEIPVLPDNPKNILHVSTNVSTYSGIPRLIRRWIQQDTQRSYSLALTNQAPNEVPKILKEAVLDSHGSIYVLNERTSSVVARAKKLREIAATADIVVLHAWEHDVIPTIAFADQEQSPPVIYVNHGDHWFWLGVSISDVVANLRESGMRFSHKRRGIETERNFLLPTVLEPSHRLLSRIEAKRKIGIAENSVLLLSIARASKYKTIGSISFADAHIPLLEKYEQAILIVIGPGNTEDWSAAIERTQGRIKVLGQTEDTAVYYQAADIYVDSFPFVSITSLLEAGSYGVPLVSRFPYSNTCEIFGADMPGLTGNLIRVRDQQEYIKVLSHLVENQEFRLSVGEATKQQITDKHIGSNWLYSLDNLYLRAVSAKRKTVTPKPIDQMFLGEPDCFLPITHGTEYDLDSLIQSRLGIMPFDERLRIWIQMSKKYGIRNRIGLLLPDSYSHSYSRLRSFLPF